MASDKKKIRRIINKKSKPPITVKQGKAMMFIPFGK